MNRTLTNVLFGGIAAPTGPVREMEGTITKTNIDEVVEDLVGSSSVIIVPGYGMAVAKAQYAIAEMVKILQAKNVKVRFAVHPVAGRCIDTLYSDRRLTVVYTGRMPGQCNVLLAEAGVPSV